MDRILIADDHPLVRDALRTVVDDMFAGARIAEATTFGEAVQAIEQGGEGEQKDSFDLVLLDLNLPDEQEFSGLETLRQRFPSMPVVIVSGMLDESLVKRALALGAAGFIPKSLKRSAILDALNTIMSGEVFIPEYRGGEAGGDLESKEILARIATLTAQQRVVLDLLVAGNLNKQIAFKLGLSMTTVKAHVSAILKKLQVYSRTQAVILAHRVNLTSR